MFSSFTDTNSKHSCEKQLDKWVIKKNDSRLAAIVVFWLVVRLGRRTLTILVVGLGMEPMGLMVISWELATVVVTFKAAIGFNKVRGALVPPSSDVATVVTITGLACPPRLSSQRGAR